MQRVLITGMGIYSTIGKNLDEVRDSLFQGKSGIGFEAIRKEYGYRSGLTGIIESPNLKGLLDRRSRVGLAEQGKYAYISMLEALKNANPDNLGGLPLLGVDGISIIGHGSSSPLAIKNMEMRVSPSKANTRSMTG